LVIPAVLGAPLPPVPPKLVGGVGLSLTSVGFCVLFAADRGGTEALAVLGCKFCKSLVVEEEAVAGPGVLAMDTLLCGAFSGAECLTLKVSFCCATTLTLIPTTTIPT